MHFFEGKKLILVGIIVVLLAAIPLTVFFLQQTQETRSRAQAATTLYFATSGQTTPLSAPITKKVGESLPLDIIVDPGTNQVSFIKLSISYDDTKLEVDKESITKSLASNPESYIGPLEDPIYTNGNISITLGMGTNAIQQKIVKVATITFKVKAVTDSTPTQVKFLTGQTQVLSSASTDAPSENVLASTQPASIVITSGSSITPTATPSAATTPVPTTPQTANTNPTCSSLTLDRTPSGAAPFAVSFTANGTDADGTISKVTFNFGDGPVQDVTQSGGIGTKNISTQISHTYNNPGTYQASAILTDNQGGVSGNTCVQTITVTAKPTVAAGGGGTNPQPPAATTAPINPNTGIKPTMAPPGPGDTIVQVGVIGTILSILGALTFFAL